MKCHIRSIKNISSLALLLSLLFLISGCASFESKVENAQREILESVDNLGYSPNDVKYFSTKRRERNGKTWNERDMRLRDHEDRSWQELHQYFSREVKYNFDNTLTVGESESDIERIRWFEFKINQFYTIFRLEFKRPQTNPDYMNE